MRTTEVLVVWALLLVCLGLAHAKDPTLFSKINSVQLLTVKVLGYTNGGVFSPIGTPCLNPVPNNPCMHIVYPGYQNSVQISWQPNANSTILTPQRLANLTALGATVELAGCFSNISSIDRGWRKPKDLIRKDNQCKTVIKEGLPLAGNYSWALGGNVASATMFIRAYIRVPSPQYGADATTPVGFGQTIVNSGFFQTQQINNRPTDLVAAASVCACVGPLIFIGFFTVDKVLKKRK